MQFACLPVLETMENIYRLPRTPSRFQAYVAALQDGTKGDLKLPIGGFNPMGKEHVREQLLALKQLGIEEIIAQVALDLSVPLDNSSSETIQVAFNLADDLHGGWTHRYSTDFDSKFKLNALVERNFCTPFFWTSESYSVDLIKTRTREQCYRTLFWKQQKRRLHSLTDYLQQEIFVCKKQNAPVPDVDVVALDLLRSHYETHKNSEDYNLIFNFFYGDTASEALGYPSFGVDDVNGFTLAAIWSK